MSTQAPATTTLSLATLSTRAPTAAQLGADPRTLSLLTARQLSLPSLPELPRVPNLEDFQFTNSRQQQQQSYQYPPQYRYRPLLHQLGQQQQQLVSPHKTYAATVQAVQLPAGDLQVLAEWKLWPWRYVHTQQCLAASSLNLTFPNAGLAFSPAAENGDPVTSEDSINGASLGTGSAQSSETALKLRRAVVGRRRVRMSPIVVNPEQSAVRSRRQAQNFQLQQPNQRRQRTRQQQRPLIRRQRTTPQTTGVGEAMYRSSRPLELLVAVDSSGKCWNGSHTVNARSFADYVLNEYDIHHLQRGFAVYILYCWVPDLYSRNSNVVQVQVYRHHFLLGIIRYSLNGWLS